MTTRHEETSDTAARLDAAGRDLRETLRRGEELAAAQGRLPGEDLVASFEPPRTPTLVADDGPSPAGVGRRLALVAGVLLVASVAGFLVLSRDPLSAELPAVSLPAVSLGAEAPRVELRAPSGSGASYAAFDWSGSWAPEWSARIDVFDAQGVRLHGSPALASPPWTPERATHAAWPQRIRWDLVLHDDTGLERARWSAEARR